MQEHAHKGASRAAVRDRWLAYCREVVNDTDHHAQCAALGGSDGAGGFPVDVRWPGYLGPLYSPGGLLWVANIHRNFDSAGLTEQFASAAADVVRRYRATDNGVAYLAETGATYQRGLAAWNVVGTRGFRVLDRLGLTLVEIAYLNAARCQHVSTGERLQKFCQRRWPLRTTVALLRPALLVITSDTALKAAGASPWPCTVIAYNQRNGRLTQASPWKPISGSLRMDDWLEELPELTDLANGSSNGSVQSSADA